MLSQISPFTNIWSRDDNGARWEFGKTYPLMKRVYDKDKRVQSRFRKFLKIWNEFGYEFFHIPSCFDYI